MHSDDRGLVRVNTVAVAQKQGQVLGVHPDSLGGMSKRVVAAVT
tara:strand:- start:127 stop:258 length:132 start_codon:yes stop_codon:yes gene_type:complete